MRARPHRLRPRLNQTGDPPTDDRYLAFPICANLEDYGKVVWRIRSLNEPTRAAIEKVQPYNRLKPDQWFMRLWWLAQLDDIDKHRLAHLAVVAAQAGEVATNARRGTYQALWNDGTLVDGAPIFRLRLTEPDPNVQVDLQATGAVVLKAEDFPPISVYWITKHIRREVVVVCRYLATFFV